MNNALLKSKEEPLTTLEEQVTTSLLKRKLNNNRSEATIQQTRGQPLYLTKVTKTTKKKLQNKNN